MKSAFVSNSLLVRLLEGTLSSFKLCRNLSCFLFLPENQDFVFDEGVVQFPQKMILYTHCSSSLRGHRGEKAPVGTPHPHYLEPQCPLWELEIFLESGCCVRKPFGGAGFRRFCSPAPTRMRVRKEKYRM